MDKKLKDRKDIDDKYKWKLEDIYESDKEWNDDFDKAKKIIRQLSDFKGKIKDSESLLNVLKLNDALQMIIEKLFVYARMKRDEDNSNGKYQALTDKAMRINIEASSATSFIAPEILSMDEKILKSCIEENADFIDYRHFLEDLLRYKPHTLSDKEEMILAESEVMAHSPENIFKMLDNADIRFPSIEDEDGDLVELTHGNYIRFISSKDRNVRKKSFESLYSVYKNFANTYAAMTDSNVKKDVFYSKIRNYSTSLEASLFDDNVPVSVYDNLIEAIHEKINLLHRYVSLRKRMLNLDELHMYDLYVPLVADFDKEYEYEEAKDIVLKALEPLGNEYVSILREGFDSRWIDVYENRGKTSGAYSWGTYGVHPFVLLNFQGKLDDVFTIAHEMGHSLHTYYSDKAQKYINSHYKIFVAEVASTCNESILIDYLLKNARDKSEKLYLLNHYLEQFKGTIFRQVMFAEFEKYTHEEAEKGEALTAEKLCKKYHELNQFYYGNDIIVDDEIDYEWERIPHFYSSFYVYKYATGFSAAVALSQMILNEGDAAVKRYIEFLKSGGSDYPLNILKKAGVDLTTKKPVLDALTVFENVLDEMERLLDR
ncbi:oligoendopeptidase F [Thermoanaerobacterium xylanolyticum LX-11]|uniref:Oligopeptidase F n=1 Tax=Thermoanaerobacterium xylanolyticum (strain ATCC 49914 / DSM 7097 / LX-11) TaxID=858215 RepID=F6BKK7_THEXL|nr:oligoendopeptidase F [Thermoanaerobacterium xylanolyticum]AEF17139.1 oligoendopeptidase F [Thermoanaerobacterium xylanolyticum LX-11]